MALARWPPLGANLAGVSGMNPYTIGAAGLLSVALLSGAWLHGNRTAKAACDAQRAVERAAAQDAALDQAKRVDRLYVEIEALRAKPERVRTVVREVKVNADADCKSLPPDFRSLWNAIPRATDAPGAAAVGDGSVPGVADPSGNGTGRD